MPERRVLSTTVIDVSWLTPGMVRIVIGGPDLAGLSVGPFADTMCSAALETRCAPTPCVPGIQSVIC